MATQKIIKVFSSIHYRKAVLFLYFTKLSGHQFTSVTSLATDIKPFIYQNRAVKAKLTRFALLGLVILLQRKA